MWAPKPAQKTVSEGLWSSRVSINVYIYNVCICLFTHLYIYVYIYKCTYIYKCVYIIYHIIYIIYIYIYYTHICRVYIRKKLFLVSAKIPAPRRTNSPRWCRPHRAHRSWTRGDRSPPKKRGRIQLCCGDYGIFMGYHGRLWDTYGILMGYLWDIMGDCGLLLAILRELTNHNGDVYIYIYLFIFGWFSEASFASCIYLP